MSAFVHISHPGDARHASGNANRNIIVIKPIATLYLDLNPRRRIGSSFLKNKVIDTISLARQRLPTQHRYSLRDLSTFLDIDALSGVAHRALPDAMATMEVFVKLVCHSPPLKSPEELFAITRPLTVCMSR